MKPTKGTGYYDYSDCCDYLEKKYGYEESGTKAWHKGFQDSLKAAMEFYNADPKDFEEDLSKLPEGEDRKRKLAIRNKVYTYKDTLQPKLKDFWQWVCDACDPQNGGKVTFYEEYPPDEDWQEKIFMYYIEEFGEGEVGKRTLTMETSW